MHKDVFNHLVNNGYDCKYNNENQEIAINIVHEKQVFELIMRFPEFYPYEFPEIFLFQSVTFKIPHRYKDKQLCLVDINEETAQPERYLEIADLMLQRAVELLRNSMERRTLLEYNKEAVTYWNSNADLHITLIECDIQSSHYIWYYQLGDTKLYFMADTADKLKNYIEHTFKKEIENSDINQALFVNVGFTLLSSLKALRDIKLWLINEKNNNIYFDYMSRGYKENLIIFNADNGYGECFLAIKIGKLLSNGIKINRKNISGIISANGGRQFERIGVRDIRMKRLFTRGGDGLASFDKKCLFAGVGSVGGYLAKAVVEIGITENISVLDNDYLSVDNIGRHVCGYSYILSDSKADAVRNYLLDKYPALTCESINKNILEYLIREPQYFESFDIVFIAVGNTVIEKKVIELINLRKIQRCVILWVEPYLVAGHALILNDAINELTKQYIFDDQGNFKLSVLNNSKKYLKSEAGCQSAYAPYSGFEVQKFILDFVEYYHQKIYLKNESGNFSYTWLGRMKGARKAKLDIKPEWRSKDDGCIEVKRIDKE